MMKTANKYIRQVIACPNCNGAGEVLIDPGDHSKVYNKINCTKCLGSGRLVRKTAVEYEPYNEDQKVMVRI